MNDEQINDNNFLMMGRHTATLTDKAEEGFFVSYFSAVAACLLLCDFIRWLTFYGTSQRFSTRDSEISSQEERGFEALFMYWNLCGEYKTQISALSPS